ncbi:MAG TPA: ferrous iron transport protein A [Clostridiaceae bacterium]|mgnify:CR=1 FL=1|jgi:Fe2+ transport system protein FeoA|nr:ferrous iron transport protein A [Clostridiaceae bacterium]
MTLKELNIGHSAVIIAVRGQGALRDRLLDMGLTPRTKVTVVKAAPMGDPIEIELRCYSLTLRKEDAANIVVESTEELPPCCYAQHRHGGMRNRADGHKRRGFGRRRKTE